MGNNVSDAQTFTFTGTLTNGSPTISGITPSLPDARYRSGSGLSASGTGTIPTNTFISVVGPALAPTTIVMTKNATASGTATFTSTSATTKRRDQDFIAAARNINTNKIFGWT